MFRVVGIGDLAIDYYYQCAKWPEQGDKAMVTLVKSELGGMIANAVSIMSKYGAEVYLMDDIYEGHKDFVLSNLKEFNVKSDCLTYNKRNITTTTNIMITDEERTIFINWCKEKRCLNEEQKKQILNADCIYTTINDFKMIHDLKDFLRENKVRAKVVLDLESNTFESYAMDKYYFDMAHVIFINDYALEKLEKEISLDEIINQDDKIIVLTKGKDGCEVRTKHIIEHIPAIKAKVVDTTGAGDMFNSTFICSLFKGKELVESATLATFAAGRSIENIGNKNISEEVLLELKINGTGVM